MNTDLCPTTSPHPAHRRDLGPFGVQECPGVADTPDAPYDAGDAPTTTVRPLPTHGAAHVWQTTAIDLAHQLATAGRQIVTLTAERDQARADRDQAYQARDVLRAQRDQAHATIASQAEQLRRNGTLLCRLRDLDEQRDRAWADHDTIGDTVIPDNPTALRAAARHLRLLAEDHQADSLGFGIEWAANALDAWANAPDDLTEDDVDALAQALEKADSARIDRDGDLWRPTTDGRWTCPGLDRLTLDELEDGWGPTRAVLLVDIEPDDSDQADALGSPAPRAQELPAWVLDLVRGLDRYELEHPKLFRYLGEGVYQPWDCPAHLLKLVPAEVRRRADRKD
jgi:hypothetical protein